MNKRKLAEAIRNLVKKEIRKSFRTLKEDIREEVLEEVAHELKPILEDIKGDVAGKVVKRRNVSDQLKEALRDDVEARKSKNSEQVKHQFRKKLKNIQEQAMGGGGENIDQFKKAVLDGDPSAPEQGFTQHGVPDHLKEAVNRDYSELVKRFKK